MNELFPPFPWSFLFIQDLIGTIVFAISGAIAARQHKMDIFGMFVLALVTGVGGGTLRDVMISSTPVFWMKQPIYVLMISVAVVIVAILKNQIDRDYWKKGLLIFDAIGLGVFTVIGVQKGLDFGLHPLICVALGGVTGCFGGLIRDILRNEVPVILQKEVYVTASLIGGIIFILFRDAGFESNWIDVATVTTVIAIRMLTIKFNMHLPKI
ncbi:trimeric intracellular cation channel family protein [Glaesserella parasuis]|uniref:trimeric intracellular cation channel family protein n=1 Tax=Glaesserella parasuis TaxID=738 RepID=UPI001A93BFD9|nr:trimeric intracellular cation channel family protein [Glaesserella parasuis]MDO9915850.1 trimeric intracellular cation channel family protein [Glaesserella parasuis]MDO9918042.1 trimeric intracellular cation channel family protein [Glaesserella parasuis]MDP0105009.1 trimeric intracellular cation channel family protein [Glaesserella parasuis]QSX12958.1 trimeric intracellular cation channel family protein [Glaesserella parasuis]